MAAREMVIILVVLPGAPSLSSAGQAELKGYAGRAVADVLRELQATHLKIIFSSERDRQRSGSPESPGALIHATSPCRSSSRTD